MEKLLNLMNYILGPAGWQLITRPAKPLPNSRRAFLAANRLSRFGTIDEEAVELRGPEKKLSGMNLCFLWALVVVKDSDTWLSNEQLFALFHEEGMCGSASEFARRCAFACKAVLGDRKAVLNRNKIGYQLGWSASRQENRSHLSRVDFSSTPLCRCNPLAMLLLEGDLSCARCGSQQLDEGERRDLNEVNRLAASDDPAELPVGRLAEVAFIRRGYGPSPLCPAVGQLISIPHLYRCYEALVHQVMLSERGGWLRLLTSTQSAGPQPDRSSTLGDNEVEQLVSRVNAGDDLQRYIAERKKEGRIDAVLLAEGLASHVLGSDPADAVLSFVRLLKKYAHPPRVRDAILFRISRALTALGDPEGALQIVTDLIDSPTADQSDRTKYLVHTLNLAYISQTPLSLRQPAAWAGFEAHLQRLRALSTESDETACIVKISESILEANQAAPRSKPALAAHRRQLRALKDLEKIDPAAAWNRLTPLTAQAVIGGHTAFAQDVHNYAYAEARRAGSYANKQMTREGLEWQLFRVQTAILNLETQNYEAALEELNYLIDSDVSARLRPFHRYLRGCRIRANRAMGSETQRDENSGLNLPARSHCLYFPKWEERYFG